MAEPSNLREALVSAYGIEDLKILVYDLGVDPEVIPQHNTGDKPAFAMEIIFYFEKRGRLDRLVTKCAQDRPHLPWQQLFDAHRHMQADGAMPPDEIGQQLQKGIDALEVLSTDRQAGQAIALIREDLQEASNNIIRLSSYKRLHDLLQDLESNYIPIETSIRLLAADQTAWRSLSLHLAKSQDIIGDLQATAKQAPLAGYDIRWVGRLIEVKQAFQTALDNLDLDNLDSKPIMKALDGFRRIIEYEPPRINFQLVIVVKNMLDSSLLARLGELRDTLAVHKRDAARFDDFELGIGAWTMLREQLRRLVTEHDEWHRVDEALNRIESNLSRDPEELQRSWVDVAEFVRPLLEGNAADWAIAIVQLDTRMQDALKTKSLRQAESIFHRYVSAAKRRFKEVNDELLRMCGELQKVGDRLQPLLYRI